MLAPASESELGAVVKLAGSIAAEGNAKATLASRQFAKGLVEYRRGEFSNAIQWMQTTRETGSRHDLPAWSHERERNRTVMSLLVEGMALQRLKRAAAARAALANATDIIKAQFPEPDCGDLGREWPDWLICHILLREAKALID
jgi:hypothetical protein